MAKLFEEAKAYEPPQTKNIADLEIVRLDSKVEDREYTDKEGKTFKMKVLIANGEEYRVPSSVLKTIKVIIEEKPETKAVKVKRSGEGLNTAYTVFPL